MGCPICGSAAALVRGSVFEDVTKTVIVGNERRPLTEYEWVVLSELRRKPGCAVADETVLRAMYGNKYEENLKPIKTLKVFVSFIRDKLRGTPYDIGRVHETGYCFVELPRELYLANAARQQKLAEITIRAGRR